MKDKYQETIYACFIGYVVQAVVNNFVPLLFLTFEKTYGIPLGKITMLITLNFGVQLIVDLLSAGLVDKIGYRVSIVIAHAASALGLIGLVVLPNLLPDAYTGILLSVMIYAIGGGLIEVLISPIMESCPTDNKEKAMSLLHSFYCWGHVAVVLISTCFFFTQLLVDLFCARFDFNCIDWHWHTELEFVYVQSGTVTAWIGEKQLELPSDSGIFINSKFLHRFSSPVDAVIPNFLCMPSFLAATDSYIYQNYVKPIVTSNIPFWIFCREISWQARVLDLMKQIFSAQTSGSSCHLLTSALMQQLWLEIYEHTDLSTSPEITGQFSVNRARLQLMMQFIHENYRKNLSLDEIAAQSMISKSSALNLFRRYLYITPVNYLINYRLKQAALLLSHTEKKVSTISAETGFHNVDYFCRAFKKHYQVTPGEYRKEKWDK